MADSADYWSSKDDTNTWATAMTLFQEGYELQTQGLWAEAMACYRNSIRLHPTAEAHTFLGWVYSFLKLYDDAIAECRRAIAIDPEFGNPYNDIGAYLMELEPLYCDVIVQRWEQFTGRKAERIANALAGETAPATAEAGEDA